MYTVDGNQYNRFTNLDNVEWNIIKHLVESDSKFANNAWRILAYDDEGCLLHNSTHPELTKSERWNLVYTNNGDASVKRVFMTPYIDDAWVEQSSHLHIYVDSVTPKNHLSSTLDICVETIVHNKISNVIGDADIEVDTSNPSEFEPTEDFEGWQNAVLYKSRATVFLKSILAELNGTFVKGVGTLQFNSQLSPYGRSRQYLWNNRKFFGYSTVFSTIISGTSADNGCGY